MHKRPTHHSKPSPRPAPAPPAKETHWAEVADWYDKLVGDEGSEYHQHVVIPGIIRMLSTSTHSQNPTNTSRNFPKLNFLDLACGQGVVSRKLAALGCTVIGLDAAAPLIEAADRRNQTDRLPIRYAVADATKLLDDAGNPTVDIAPNSLDAIPLILAIQNITPLSPVWQGCRTLLKPGGSLIIVMMHPAFRIPKQSDWIWEDKGSGGVGAQGRVVYEYLTSSKVDIQTHPGQAAQGKDGSSTPHFHRPLQAYINTMTNAGLLLDHLDEWISHKVSQPGPKKAALDRARKEIPMFLALRARKFISENGCHGSGPSRQTGCLMCPGPTPCIPSLQRSRREVTNTPRAPDRSSRHLPTRPSDAPRTASGNRPETSFDNGNTLTRKFPHSAAGIRHSATSKSSPLKI